VLTSYRDLVRKGQDQFSKELEQIVPGVKIGESMFSLSLSDQLASESVYFIIKQEGLADANGSARQC